MTDVYRQGYLQALEDLQAEVRRCLQTTDDLAIAYGAALVKLRASLGDGPAPHEICRSLSDSDGHIDSESVGEGMRTLASPPSLGESSERK